jgi:hypothetical protein
MADLLLNFGTHCDVLNILAFIDTLKEFLICWQALPPHQQPLVYRTAVQRLGELIAMYGMAVPAPLAFRL